MYDIYIQHCTTGGIPRFFLGVSDGSYQLTKWNAHTSRPFFMSHILSNAFSELDEELTELTLDFSPRFSDGYKSETLGK